MGRKLKRRQARADFLDRGSMMKILDFDAFKVGVLPGDAVSPTLVMTGGKPSFEAEALRGGLALHISLGRWRPVKPPICSWTCEQKSAMPSATGTDATNWQFSYVPIAVVSP